MNTTSRSSISVSGKQVCEDDACIGKDATPQAVSPEDAAHLDEKRKKTPGTSMSVEGKEACSDDACIGKG